MNAGQLQKIKEEIEAIEAHGHGEVIIKIKNGFPWRILATQDTLLESHLTKPPELCKVKSK